MRWFKAERLTSGRRDANRIEVKGVEGAGFAITWQEDPDGLRPGQGEGPGEGWSGAIGNSQTDVWYSYIDWENFDVVQDPDDETGVTPMSFADYTRRGRQRHHPEAEAVRAVRDADADHRQRQVQRREPGAVLLRHRAAGHGVARSDRFTRQRPRSRPTTA